MRNRGPGWVAETDNPRPASSAVSPHGRVRVFFNDTLVTSLKAGHGTLTGEPLARGAMAVKELYEGETLAGHAIYYKAADGSAHASSVYYCFGPATRCLFDREETSIEKPIFGAGYDAQCHHCHGGTVFTKAP